MPSDSIQMMPSVLAAIRSRLSEGLAAADAAAAYLGHGDAEGALRIALDLEQPLHEATTLLEATALLARIGADGD